MHEAPPAKHFKSSACWPRYILSWTFLVDLYIGHWNFNIFAPTGWLLRLFYTLDPLEICSDVKPREGKPVFSFGVLLVQSRTFIPGTVEETLHALIMSRSASVSRALVWYGWFGLGDSAQNPSIPYFDVDTFTTRALFGLDVKSPIKPYSALLCNAYIQSRPLVCSGPSPSGHPAKIWIGV